MHFVFCEEFLTYLICPTWNEIANEIFRDEQMAASADESTGKDLVSKLRKKLVDKTTIFVQDYFNPRL